VENTLRWGDGNILKYISLYLIEWEMFFKSSIRRIFSIESRLPPKEWFLVELLLHLLQDRDDHVKGWSLARVLIHADLDEFGHVW